MSTQKITSWSLRAAGAAGLTTVMAACGIASPSSPAARPQTRPPFTVTEHVAPSALVTVTGGTVTAQALSGLVFATARPSEDLAILRAGMRPHALIGSSSPAPAAITVPGRPGAPGPGATPYLWALYRKNVKIWHAKVSAGKQEAAARTRAATSAWARGLPIPPTAGGTSSAWGYPGGLASPDNLAAECNLAAGAMTGLDQEAAGRFGDRRVMLLYAPNLNGTLREDELTGDDVIVILPYVPSAARASTAQAKLLDAGAVRATVLGPEVTPAQIAQLVRAGLSQKVITETLSGSVPFAGRSPAMLPRAARVLTPLLPALRRPGAVAVVNGYAYTAGSLWRNYKLSLARAAAVASYLENHGIPASSLIVVGHGISRVGAHGSPGANGGVLVVVEAPGTA